MSEEKFVIVRDVKFKESDIEDLRQTYLGNLVRICRAGKVSKITPHSLEVIDRYTENPYIDYSDPELFKKLGHSIINDGMHWVFIIKDGAIHEGVHRYLSLRELVQSGEFKEEELSFPALDITDDKFKEPVKIEFYKFRRRFNWISKYGFEKRYLFYNEFSTAMVNFMSMSAVLKHIYFAWKEKYGKEFPTSELISDYDKLMEVVNSDQYKD